MRIVNVTSPILGRQFDPFLKGEVMPGHLDLIGKHADLIRMIDPLKVDPRVRSKETWSTDEVHLMRDIDLSRLDQVSDNKQFAPVFPSDNRKL
ncbi:MAG: hypothetical protein RIS08_149 [Actinomycetota bacterium]|jgi:hypothetical protein